MLSDVFFWISKLVWLLISPDNILLILFGVCVFLLWREHIRLAKYLMNGLFVICLFIGLFPVGEWLLYPLESQNSVNPKLNNVDGIIVLSGAEDPVKTDLWQQISVNDAVERDLVFMQLARQFPNAKLIFSGGSGSMVHQQQKQADVARRLFKQQGLQVERIIFERESRNTWENAVNSKSLLVPDENEKWVLITTAWHMPRSLGSFCKVGWNVTPYPVDFRTRKGDLLRLDWNFASHLKTLKTGIKEWLGLFAYRYSGKSC